MYTMYVYHICIPRMYTTYVGDAHHQPRPQTSLPIMLSPPQCHSLHFLYNPLSPVDAPHMYTVVGHHQSMVAFEATPLKKTGSVVERSAS